MFHCRQGKAVMSVLFLFYASWNLRTDWPLDGILSGPSISQRVKVTFSCQRKIHVIDLHVDLGRSPRASGIGCSLSDILHFWCQAKKKFCRQISKQTACWCKWGQQTKLLINSLYYCHAFVRSKWPLILYFWPHGDVCDIFIVGLFGTQSVAELLGFLV